jgi:hypothetical protein
MLLVVDSFLRGRGAVWRREHDRQWMLMTWRPDHSVSGRLMRLLRP